MSSDEYAPPKYAQIVQAIRRKIDDGTFPPGSLLPSETQLVREFSVSRPTVVRALQVLQLRGIIEREHGKGSFVKAVPPSAEEVSRPSRAVLDRIEADEPCTVVEATLHEAPAVVADLLDLPEKVEALMRRLLFTADGRPSELVTLWLPADLADDSSLTAPAPLSTGVRRALEARGVRLTHVVERMTARHPRREEVRLLGLKPSAPVLNIVAKVSDSAGRPAVIVDLVMPGSLHELEDAYAL
ncbi:GntR family transcriptional regulator [Nonomuraea sp. NPDC050328]|uniref:GntR family transcriptional regulator n=1 Tax=Nonomuraea sp. NPDC050328 TaxID=3364361 RepID=UPI0037BB0F87